MTAVFIPLCSYGHEDEGDMDLNGSGTTGILARSHASRASTYIANAPPSLVPVGTEHDAHREGSVVASIFESRLSQRLNEQRLDNLRRTHEEDVEDDRKLALQALPALYFTAKLLVHRKGARTPAGDGQDKGSNSNINNTRSSVEGGLTQIDRLFLTVEAITHFLSHTDTRDFHGNHPIGLLLKIAALVGSSVDSSMTIMERISVLLLLF